MHLVITFIIDPSYYLLHGIADRNGDYNCVVSSSSSDKNSQVSSSPPDFQVGVLRRPPPCPLSSNGWAEDFEY